MICPHDGYHFRVDYLKTLPDAQDLLYRRGAPEMFDPQALLQDLRRIRNGNEEIITLPSFHHTLMIASSWMSTLTNASNVSSFVINVSPDILPMKSIFVVKKLIE
jgi:pantothenate kinase